MLLSFIFTARIQNFVPLLAGTITVFIVIIAIVVATFIVFIIICYYLARKSASKCHNADFNYCMYVIYR